MSSSKPSSPDPAPRKGAVRIADISPTLLKRLSRGDEPTRTAIEWMAIDMPLLVRSTLPQVGLSREAERVALAVEAVAGRGILERTDAIVSALERELPSGAKGERILERLSAHPMDSVRNWACLLVQRPPKLRLQERLQRGQRFAADPHMAVREFAWMALRPHLARELDAAWKLLQPWVEMSDANLRRCAVEATRPRGVWCAHIAALKDEPSVAVDLLDAVRADESLYVRKSVGNWLNDASKTRPDWVKALCKRWTKGTAHPHTLWIVKHGQRSLR